MGLLSILFGSNNKKPKNMECPENFNGTEDEYFDSLINEENFPGYTVERKVPASRFNADAHPSCLPVSYLLSKGSEPVLAVLLMQTNQCRAMIAKGTYEALEGKQIPYMRFFKGFRNEKNYVLDRVRAGLEGQL